MKHFFSLLTLTFLISSQAFAQSSDSQRLAMVEDESSRSDTPVSPVRLACAPLLGQVVDGEGQPLTGATLLIKGTQHVYITDNDGRFQLTAPVYYKQVMAVEAAGYTTRLIPLNDCKLPVVVLERDPSSKIKRTGKRAGQVTRRGDAFMQ
ncbi:carboxypeptidase-like regulatory domain-containing protein [Hymenobacter sp. BT635]|uniref:Carboxypeptidase-like regulatory domain-containing protein n=1 Tax=Hymenobacter nitidus TaxID=2880929 RepID=A0ABS8AIQ7_9BACT|nr:carboxypeptidase-like regulatory domain-containing protein [Hymenobacter nitidus]MCB2379369.1 carboxypeptidase-like regulatory domain-containing protein [Hymenobacter nitidus]